MLDAAQPWIFTLPLFVAAKTLEFIFIHHYNMVHTRCKIIDFAFLGIRHNDLVLYDDMNIFGIVSENRTLTGKNTCMFVSDLHEDTGERPPCAALVDKLLVDVLLAVSVVTPAVRTVLGDATTIVVFGLGLRPDGAHVRGPHAHLLSGVDQPSGDSQLLVLVVPPARQTVLDGIDQTGVIGGC